MSRNQHVVKRPNGWAVRGEQATRDTSHHQTQSEAIARAREDRVDLAGLHGADVQHAALGVEVAVDAGQAGQRGG